MSEESAARLGWNLYLTNLREEVLPGVAVGVVYRLRWQIELLFKLWKSGLGLAHTPNKKLARVWCEIYARLIGYSLLVYLSWGTGWESQVAEEASLETVAEAEEAVELPNPLHQLADWRNG